MFDVHHHLLYGLDDGPKTIEDSILQARAAAANGITHVVCTPHSNHRYPYVPELVGERLAAVRAALAELEIPLILGLGSDFHITYDNVEDAKRFPARYTINGQQYLLIELPEQFLQSTVTNAQAELMSARLIPVLTHPERNTAIQRDPGRIRDWIADGMLVQVTTGSFLGRFGKTAASIAHRYLEDNWITVIASDAHNITSRPPNMREAYEYLAQRYGDATAHRLCVANPQAMYEGAPLRHGYQRGIDDDLPLQMESKGFFRRLFGL